jgi:NAD(P)-dependent dehydrogenase (short-subunit alcohol dehydrogenase family)
VDTGLDLSAKNVLVTGGSMGIGFAVAEECLRAGARVVICARDGSKVREAVAQLRQNAGTKSVDGIAGDVTDVRQIEAALDLLASRFGPVTSLVHAAAVQGPIGELTAIDPADWLEAVRVDLFGAFLTARQTCERLKKTGGRIVMFSGGGATTPLPGLTAYACSKAGVVRLAETIAIEMAPYDIEVNALAPGPVATRMLEGMAAAGRAPEGEPVPAKVGAEAAAFLISDRARGITGKLVAARFDDWRHWPERLRELHQSDAFTLRRIVPRDRGMDWQ